MRHNKFVGWDKFLDVVEKVQKVSPWLSRQIAKRASEWPFWASGVHIEDWQDRQVWTHLPLSFRNSLDGEICYGHLALAAELTLRLLLLRKAQELPFRYRVLNCRIENHHAVNQSVDFKFALSHEEWEKIRLELARAQRYQNEFYFSAKLADGRLAASIHFQVAFELEKFLPAY